jgi:deaminated glutathione amidase
MSLAVIQMVSQSDVLANLAQARRLLEEAAQGGAQLAVLPENFAAMGRRDDVAAIGRAEACGRGADPAVVETGRPRPQVMDSGRHLAVCPQLGSASTPRSNACSLLIDARGCRCAGALRQAALCSTWTWRTTRGRYRESDDYAHGELRWSWPIRRSGKPGAERSVMTCASRSCTASCARRGPN